MAIFRIDSNPLNYYYIPTGSQNVCKVMMYKGKKDKTKGKLDLKRRWFYLDDKHVLLLQTQDLALSAFMKLIF